MPSSLSCTAESERLGALLRRRGFTLAVAESCTGGMIGEAVTAVAGSSRYFLGGVIAYHDRIKASFLGVSPSLLRNKGAVSAEVVSAMARGVQNRVHADCAIAVSGVAGPDGGTPEKPVGLVYIGICAKNKRAVFEERFRGKRESIRRQTVKKALARLRGLLQ
jgi:PncC family amidohydrolase